MWEEIKAIKSDKGELKKFGVTIAIALALLGGLFLWRKGSGGLYFFIFSAVFLGLALIFPVVLKPVQKVWMTAAVILGWMMTRLILSILFYLVLTPIGTIARVCGRTRLDVRYSRDATSYWISRKGHEFKKENYEKQF